MYGLPVLGAPRTRTSVWPARLAWERQERGTRLRCPWAPMCALRGSLDSNARRSTRQVQRQLLAIAPQSSTIRTYVWNIIHPLAHSLDLYLWFSHFPSAHFDQIQLTQRAT